MVERISVMLTDQIIRNKLISDNMREWYIYAFSRLFETAISLGMLMIVGFGTNRLLEFCYSKLRFHFYYNSERSYRPLV